MLRGKIKKTLAGALSLSMAFGTALSSVSVLPIQAEESLPDPALIPGLLSLNSVKAATRWIPAPESSFRRKTQTMSSLCFPQRICWPPGSENPPATVCLLSKKAP